MTFERTMTADLPQDTRTGLSTLPTDGTGAAEGRSPEPLPRDVAAGDAFRHLAAELLSSLAAHRPAAMAGEMDGVHGMRIGTRRLRALLALFHPCLAPEPEARFNAALRRFAAFLGEVRDWDVFLAETLPRAGPAAEGLRLAAEAARRAARDRMESELRNPATKEMFDSFLSWAADPAALSGDVGGGSLAGPLRNLLPGLLDRLARKGLQRGRHIRRRSDDELHHLRKALKRLRYAVEFVAFLHKEKRVAAYLRRLKRLQEKLGGLNDAAVADTLARRLAEGDRALAPAAAAVSAWAERQGEEARRDLRKGWREFRDAELPPPAG